MEVESGPLDSNVPQQTGDIIPGNVPCYLMLRLTAESSSETTGSVGPCCGKLIYEVVSSPLGQRSGGRALFNLQNIHNHIKPLIEQNARQALWIQLSTSC